MLRKNNLTIVIVRKRIFTFLNALRQKRTVEHDSELIVVFIDQEMHLTE